MRLKTFIFSEIGKIKFTSSGVKKKEIMNERMIAACIIVRPRLSNAIDGRISSTKKMKMINWMGLRSKSK
jgi:predicted XRE-type DNA-binding protein